MPALVGIKRALLGGVPADGRGSVLYADFVRGRYFVRGRRVASSSSIQSNARSTTAWGQDLAGNLWSAPASQSLIIGGRGLLSSTQRTNNVLYCRDLTNAAWTKSNITAALDQTGIDGVANSASRITAGASNATVLQAITLSSAARYQTAYVKRLSGSGTVQMTMDGGTTWTTVTVTAAWTRVSIASQTLANPNVGFRLVTSGDAIAVDVVQNEAGSYASAPILTAGSAVQRNGDAATLLDPTLIPISGSVYVEWEEMGSAGDSSQHTLWTKRVDPLNFFCARTITSRATSNFSSGGTGPDLQSTNAPAAGNIYRNAVAYAANDFAAALTASLRATVLTSASGNLLASDGAVGIGNQNGALQLDGFIRKLIAFPTRKPNADLLAWAQAA